MKKLIILAAFLLTIFSPYLVIAQETNCRPDALGTYWDKTDPKKPVLCAIKLNTDIGTGKIFSLKGNPLGIYVQYWYGFIIGSVGIMATVMIMWAGFRWLSSRGNAGIISDQKDRIFSAIIGLMIAFLSYTILNIINPNLLIIKLPTLPELPSITQICCDGVITKSKSLAESDVCPNGTAPKPWTCGGVCCKYLYKEKLLSVFDDPYGDVVARCSFDTVDPKATLGSLCKSGENSQISGYSYLGKEVVLSASDASSCNSSCSIGINAEGQFCSNKSDCEKGLACIPAQADISINRRCGKPLGKDGICDDSSQCQKGLYCDHLPGLLGKCK